MHSSVRAHHPEIAAETFLIERQLSPPVAELMVSVRTDQVFGFAMTLASGGILVELLSDLQTILLPAHEGDIATALSRLRISPLLSGYRGRPGCDIAVLTSTLLRLSDYVLANSRTIREIEINPLYCMPDEAVAVDVLIAIAPGTG